MILLWATRGRSWGFRFLPVGRGAADGMAADGDPLGLYERAFAGHADGDEGCWAGADGLTAVRLSDPEGRRDEAGRVIPHEFVLRGEEVRTVGDALAVVWPRVAAQYAEVWDGPRD